MHRRRIYSSGHEKGGRSFSFFPVFFFAVVLLFSKNFLIHLRFATRQSKNALCDFLHEIPSLSLSLSLSLLLALFRSLSLLLLLTLFLSQTHSFVLSHYFFVFCGIVTHRRNVRGSRSAITRAAAFGNVEEDVKF